MSKQSASGLADITVASVQSLVSGDRIDKFNPAAFKLILIDEAHHAAAPTYLKVLKHFNADSRDSLVYIVGVSATLSRFDGLKLGVALDRIVYHKDYIDMIGEKWLCPVNFTAVKSNADLSKVTSDRFGDFNLASLSRQVNTIATNDLTVRTWLDLASSRLSTIVFCVDMQHVRDLTYMFRQKGVDACYITSKTVKREREMLLDRFKDREYPVLLNCGIFTEGTDIPGVDCVLLCRPSRSRNLIVQMIGRGMRLHEGKVNCHVIDMIGSLDDGIACTPTLFGLDPNEIIHEESAEALMKRAEARKARNISAQTPEVEMHDSHDPLILEVSNDQKIVYHNWSYLEIFPEPQIEHQMRRTSKLAWTHVGDSKFILSIAQSGIIRIEKTELGTYTAFEVKQLPKIVTASNPQARYQKPRVIFEGVETLSQAFAAADTYVQSRYPINLTNRYSKWRLTPATPDQKGFLLKIFKTKPEKVENLRKGEAADLITKIRYGVRGYAKRKLKERNKAVQVESKAAELKSREIVQIGPIA